MKVFIEKVDVGGLLHGAWPVVLRAVFHHPFLGFHVDQAITERCLTSPKQRADVVGYGAKKPQEV